VDNQRIINFEILRNRTTIYDIARALNIPVATVSRALNGSVLIKDQLREEITAAAKELNYHPNRLASALKTKKTFMLGVLIPSLDSHFYASILHHIEREVKLSGFNILTIQTKGSLPNEINGFKTFLEAQVDGIIASILPQTEEMLHVKQVILMDKPLILLNSTNPEIQASSVSVNYYQAGFMATEHLILKGCKTIAF
jgi:LacI family transcriptional regulator